MRINKYIKWKEKLFEKKSENIFILVYLKTNFNVQNEYFYLKILLNYTIYIYLFILYKIHYIFNYFSLKMNIYLYSII